MAGRAGGGEGDGGCGVCCCLTCLLSRCQGGTPNGCCCCKCLSPHSTPTPRSPISEPQVLEHIPPLEETAYDAALEPTEAATATASSTSAAADLAALLGLDAGMGGGAAAPAVAAAPAASQANAVSALSDLLGGDLLGGGGRAAPPAAAAATADPLAGLFGAPAAAPAPLPAAPSAAQTITAYQSGPLTVAFRLERVPGDPSATEILASYSNTGDAPLEAFTLQAAVPKQMQLKLDPASAPALPPHSSGAVTQRLHVHNSLHGQKPLVMRLRISYHLGGQAVLEQGEVSNFPPGEPACLPGCLLVCLADWEICFAEPAWGASRGVVGWQMQCSPADPLSAVSAAAGI